VVEEDVDEKGEIDHNFAQEVAYASSFMYYNWHGSIKVPAVCQVSLQSLTLGSQ
jgi:hypothetical protein